MVTAPKREGHERPWEHIGGVHRPTLLVVCIREGFPKERMSMWGPEGGEGMSDVGTS